MHSVVRIIRHAPWNRHTNRRGARTVIWLVKDDTGRTVFESFTRKSAREWIASKKGHTP